MGVKSMRTRVQRVLVLSITLMSVPTVTAAQGRAPSAAPTTSTIWAEASFGRTGARLTCDVCQTTRDVGPAITLALGAYANPQLRVGLEAGRWSHDDQGAEEHVHTAGLVAHLIPDPRRGLYFLGGLGWSGYRAGDYSYDAPRVSVGTGWDLPIHGRWVAGTIVAIDASSFGAIKNGPTSVARNVGLSAFRVAVQVRRR